MHGYSMECTRLENLIVPFHRLVHAFKSIRYSVSMKFFNPLTIEIRNEAPKSLSKDLNEMMFDAHGHIAIKNVGY